MAGWVGCAWFGFLKFPIRSPSNHNYHNFHILTSRFSRIFENSASKSSCRSLARSRTDLQSVNAGGSRPKRPCSQTSHLPELDKGEADAADRRRQECRLYCLPPAAALVARDWQSVECRGCPSRHRGRPRSHPWRSMPCSSITRRQATRSDGGSEAKEGREPKGRAMLRPDSGVRVARRI